MSTQINLEALMFRPVLFSRAQMPLPQKRGTVTCLAQGFRDGNLFQSHSVIEYGAPESSFPFTTKPVGGGNPGRILACHYAVAGGAANGIDCVAVAKPHATAGQPIDVRGLVEGLGIVRTNIHIPEIVYQKEDKIGSICAL